MLASRRVNRRSVATGVVCLAFGLGAGVAAAGCGEDRDGSVDVEGGTTGGTTATTETTGTTETSTTETSTTESGY